MIYLRYTKIGERAPHTEKPHEASSGAVIKHRLLSLVAGLLAMVSIMGFPLMLSAQATSGTILGTIEDSSGAAVPDATVTVTNVGTSESKVVKTSSAGQYSVLYLIPGSYKVQVEKEGFSTVERSAFDLQVDQKARVDLTLTIGSVKQVVSVDTAAPILKSDSSEIGQVIDSAQITTLPLNVRNFSQLLTLTTGTAPDYGGQGGSVSADHPEGVSATTVNGLPSDANNWQIDGVSDNEAFFSVLTVNPSIDAIQEFKANTSNYSAEFGRAGGAHVQISIKSGTNAFHGVAFEFLRNSALDANDYFSNQNNSPKQAFRQNQFGGNIGGPLLRDRTFFFIDYEGFRSSLGESETMTVPTALQRQGIFTEVDARTGATQPAIYNPLTHLPYANNTVTNINPVSANVLQLLPLPNITAPGGGVLLVNNYFGKDTLTHRVDQGDVRVDHRVSSKNQAFVRYSNLDTTLTQPPFLGLKAGGDPYLAALSHSLNQNAVVSDVHTFSPTLLNEFRFGVNSVHLDWAALDSNLTTSSDVGIPGVNGFCPFCGGLARIQISGLSAFGHTPFAPTLRHSTVLEWIDNFTVVKGKQTIKAGVDLNNIHASLFQTSNPVGEFDFDQNQTSNAGSGGIGLASFLTSYEAGASRDAMTGYPAYRTNQYFMFGQDDIRFNEKLTLNLGLRYEIYTAPTAVNNHQANFDLATGDLLDACIATSCSAGVKTNYGNIEPRLGFAYSLNPKTVIRSAFGITTFSPGSGGQIGTLAENAPWEEGQQLNPATQYTPGPTLDQGLPALAPLQPRSGAGPGHYIAIGSHIFWLDPNLRMTKAYQWNLDVQRTLTSKLLLDVAYVGNAVTGLFLNVPGNVPNLEATPSGLSLQERRPYYATNPDLQAFTKRFNGGHSDFHSLQAKLDQRTSYGLSFLAAYTYSKELQRGRDFVDPNNYMQKDVPSQDVTHRLVVSYTYALPFGKGMRYANSSGRLLDAAIGGWQAQGISTFRSGLPFNPTISSQLENGQGNVPNRVGSGKVAHQTINNWFDPTAFTQPGDQYGNAGYNFLRGPSYKNWDLSFFKSFNYDERRYLQFRAEFFNIFNNAQFGNPGTFVCNGNCGAGVITSLAPGSNPRQIQFALKLYF